MPRFTAQPLAIGVDVDGDVVRLLQLQTLSGTCKVLAAAIEPLTGDGTTAGTAIRRALATHRFSGLDVVACLPRDAVHLRSVRVAGVVDDSLDARVLEAAGPQFPFPIDSARVQIVSAGPVRDGDKATCEAVVMAVRHEEIDAFLLPLHDAGLRILALDAPPVGIYRGIDRFCDESCLDDTRFIVELSRQQSRVLIATGREIRFFKTIDSGTAQLAKAVSRKLGISLSDADALRRRLIDRAMDDATNDSVRQAVFDATRGVAEQFARELVLCQRYFSVMFRGRPPRRLELAGHGANDPSLHRIFGSMLGLDTVALTPAVVSESTGVDLTDGSWAAVFGAALKFAPQMPMTAPAVETKELEVAHA